MMERLFRRIPKRLHDVLLGRVALGLVFLLAVGLLAWSLGRRYPQIKERQQEITRQIALERSVQNLRLQLANRMTADLTNTLRTASDKLIANEEDFAQWTQRLLEAASESGFVVGVTQGAELQSPDSFGRLLLKPISISIRGQPTFSYPDLLQFARAHILQSGKSMEVVGLQLVGNGSALTSARLDLNLWRGALAP